MRGRSLLILVCVAAALLIPLSRNSDAQETQKVPPKSDRLIVVAPKQFHAALEAFVGIKKVLRPTELVDLEQILATTDGADSPEKLKRWLFREWSERGLGYVLLVGDVSVVPVRYMVLDRVTPAAFDYSFYPSDLYYADLTKPDGSFEDWNASHSW